MDKGNLRHRIYFPRRGINELVEAGYISSNQLVKVLGNGSLTTKLDVEANAFSKSAVAAIEAVGGNAVKL